ncbi:MAG TPA: hypothetical protein PK329_00475 [Myxococcota bacterium]|nr:hypothetical protein [Myxococcota bacterium]HON24285.1 hypothetical protein [Myxococcota bacterium]HOS60956.1 hypothetical protein [Myxococcota bacterium]HPC90725.1 hypothetical protein [Myxococcota bacterium]HPL24100.1 hypothetical protein [Myxococcota bacterium]
MTNRKLLTPVIFLLAVLFTVPAFSKAKPKPGDAILRGKIEAVKVTPFNPVPDKKMWAKVFASVKRDPDGIIRVTLTHEYSGETCHFAAKRTRFGHLEFIPQKACTFKALSSKGTLKIEEGVIFEKGGRMVFDATMTIKWLNYKGLIKLNASGASTATIAALDDELFRKHSGTAQPGQRKGPRTRRR